MSAFDMGGLFAPPPLMGTHVAPPAALWPPGNPHVHSPLMAPIQSPFGHQNGFSGIGALTGLHGGSTPTGGYNSGPVMPLELSKPPDTIKGFGQLTWLSSKAGLITCKDKMVISFQIKDFCDQQLTDLTSVLRVGFTLSFQASLSESNEYIATLVSPLYGQESESVFGNSGEVNLEKQPNSPPNSKDAYGCAEEAKAIPALLGIFQRHSLPQIQLSSMHSHISSCGDEDLFRYVGSSSLKRRQFVERRTHLFKLNADDTIALQPPWVYACVCRLASRLLRRGGATAIQSLYEFFCSPEMPADIRECIGEGRTEFLSLISGHPWIFALFPNRTYVSVRRNLPHFDYATFIKQTFPDSDLFRPPSAHAHYGHGHGPAGNPGRVMRSLSHQPLSSALSAGRPQASSRPHSLWDSQTAILPPLSNSSDQWSPLFPGSNPWRPSPAPSVNSLLTTPTHNAQKVLVSAATQTDTGLGSGECVCHCTCGAGRLPSLPRSIIAPLSGGSTSPPSLDSASPSSPGPSSPVPPIRYYDPFGGTGFDVSSALSGLNL